MKKAVLFDLDGTLVNTTEFIFQAYEHALSVYNFKTVPRKILSSHIGKHLATIYKEIAPRGNPQFLMKTHFAFQAKNFHLVKAFPNILEVVTKLKKLGIMIGIVTTRLDNTIDTLKAGGLKPSLFDVIIKGDDAPNPKPFPDGIILALKKLKVKPSEAFMVGDASVDIEMGKRAGVKTVGVTWGFGGKNIKNSNPDYVIDDIKQLLRIVE